MESNPPIEEEESQRIESEGTFYCVCNDYSAFGDPPVVCAVPGGMQNAIYSDKDRAYEARDELREESGNRNLNVYRLILEPMDNSTEYTTTSDW